MLLCIGNPDPIDGSDIDKVLKEHYAMLCNTMTDIDDLLKYFVAEKIITLNEEDKIKRCATKSDKVQMLLSNISGPLTAGDTTGLLFMLKTMNDHGTVATQNLAKQIESRIANLSSSHESKLPDEHPKSLFCILLLYLLYNYCMGH